MSSEKKIGLKLNAENLGLHTNLAFEDNTDSIKIGIYANNGNGKTFISRAFRTACHSYESQKSDDLLNRYKNNGTFYFHISPENDPLKKLQIELERGAPPTINNDTGYIFHVFNSEYVDENLEEKKFVPDSNINGFILGSSNIDISNEKSTLANLQNKEKKLYKKIEKSFEKGKKSLDDLGIRSITKEYKNFNIQNLLNEKVPETEKSFDLLKNEKEKLEKIPEFSDINQLEFKIDYEFLNNINKVLNSENNEIKIEKGLVNDMNEKQEFIESGMEIYTKNGEKCPFCNQKLLKNSSILENYSTYLESQEAKIVKKLDESFFNLETLENQIKDHFSVLNEVFLECETFKNYVPSLKMKKLINSKDKEKILKLINEVQNIIQSKRENIELTNFKIGRKMNSLITSIDNLKEVFEKNNNEIKIINKKIRNIGPEKTKINKDLCDAKFKKVHHHQKSNIKDLNDIRTEISLLEAEIREKEAKNKINKKEKVAESLKYLLKFFFQDKYSFDEETFNITFNDENLSEKAIKVLSDGEKGIVAFCHYLAMTHTLITHEDDYEKLFFVIDDPISSMDYNYVYKISECIKNLNKIFESTSFNRYIILTHNLDFINLLKTNRIIGQEYLLKPNKIKIWTDKLLLPYECHLADIVEIYKNEVPPSHTTSNSIRHVLETLCHFEERNQNIEGYINRNDKLRESSYIHQIAQDLSHGRLRTDPIPESHLKDACNVLYHFIKDKYPKHLTQY